MKPTTTPTLENHRNGYEISVSNTLPYHRFNYEAKVVAIYALPDVLYCHTKETLNGERITTMRYKSNGLNANLLAIGNILFVRVNPWMKVQHMRITKVSKRLAGRNIEVTAEPVINVMKKRMGYQYATSIRYVSDYSIIFGQESPPIPKITYNGTKYKPYDFRAVQDKQVYPQDTYTVIPYNENTLALFQGSTGSVVDTWGGELVKDNGELLYYQKLGKDSAYSVEYGTNLTDIQVTFDDSSIIRYVIPYVVRTSPANPDLKYMAFAYNYGTEGTSKPNSGNYDLFWITNNYENAQRYENGQTIMLDVSDKEEDWETIFAQGEDVWKRRVISYGTQWLNANRTYRSDVTVNMKVDFINIGDRPEYAEFADLKNLQLGDTVGVRVPEMDIDTRVRVIGYEYDSVLDELVSIELGQPTGKYLQKINSNMTAMNQALNRGIRKQ